LNIELIIGFAVAAVLVKAVLSGLSRNGVAPNNSIQASSISDVASGIFKLGFRVSGGFRDGHHNA
jgi:hypothetical protein